MKMRMSMRLICVLSIIMATGCHSRTETRREPIAENRQFEKSVNRFAGIAMASQKDTTCGMPLSAGLADTVMYNNKVYGFCSKECKEDFVSKLKRENKR